MFTTIHLRHVGLASLLFLAVAATAAAEEWSQWGGPDRNFTVEARELATSWPEGGPPREWSLPLGPGHSAVVVADGTLFATYRRGDREVLVAHNAAHGGLKWRDEQQAQLWKGFDSQFGSGPHSTPLVAGGRLFTVSVRALVRCLDPRTGKVLWSHDLWQEHDAKPGDRGYASSPLEYDGALVVPTSGKGSGLVALEAASGEVRWTNLELTNNAISSPVVARVGDRDQLVAFMGREVVGVAPADGRVLWRHPHETKYRVNAMTPLGGGDGLIFVSAAYDSGSRALQLSSDGASVEELWYERKLQIHHGTAVRLGDTVVGSSGDFGPAFLTGLDVRTGELRFKSRGFAKANLLLVGEQLVILDEDGVLALASLGADGPVVHARAQVLHSVSWAAPALVGTILYLRDQRELVALDLGPRSP
ncbi:MAG: PQQ-binding-like beta-propeller repeat protein [bacterium]|nr:PQQ-binding-like beta-propeller repeat protein [bacterium]